ncbi:sulfotransferase [Bacillus sp. Marseille-Q3570]|uniref:sulfotransferase family protein n=1 Tax=Bacillus sp. Marseille-Q3570 TaxID=2963522 RepID=UPI0021B6EE95|nr:sulfotransferase [Bacillus sp. Marseille-Q3570]
MELKKPNLFIVGTQKSGSTSLHYYLSQHPDIFMSEVKEPRFFNYKYDNEEHTGPGDDWWDQSRITDLSSYMNLFKGVNNEKIIGEATIEYMYYDKVAKDLAKFNSNSKIIIILRNPIDRALSAYTHLRRDMRENLPFEKALEREEKRKLLNYHQIWHLKSVGLYYNQVKKYLEEFGENNVKIVLFEDLTKNIDHTLNDILEFLGVDSNFSFQITRKLNTSGVPKNKVLQKLIKTNGKFKQNIRLFIPKRALIFLKEKIISRNVYKPNINPDTKKILIEFFKEDITKTQDLIQRDLSKWLKY